MILRTRSLSFSLNTLFNKSLQKPEILLELLSYIFYEKEGHRNISFEILISPIGKKCLLNHLIEIYPNSLFKYCVKDEKHRIYENVEFIRILHGCLEFDSTRNLLISYLYKNEEILKFLLRNIQTIEMRDFFLNFFIFEIPSSGHSHHSNVINSTSSFRMEKKEIQEKRISLNNGNKIKEEMIDILLNQLFNEDTCSNAMVILEQVFSDHLFLNSNFILTRVLKERNEEIQHYSLNLLESILLKCQKEDVFIFYILNNSLSEFVNLLKNTEDLNQVSLQTCILTHY
jgi:hypothetical protein